MSLTSGSTIPLTPDSFSDDVTNINEDGIFAWLRPLNQTACEAYDATVNTTIKHPVKFKHIRQFLHADTRLKRAGSTYTEDGDVANEPGPFIENLQWTGAFKFSLMTLPYSPGRGWYVGTNRGQSPDGEIDIL